MSKELELTREAVNAIDSLMHDFRYDFEGPRDIDSIEEWVDNWIENKAKVGLVT